MNKEIKIIEVLNKIANGEQIPHFIIDETEYYLGADGYLKELFGDDVQWYVDSTWLNYKVRIIDEENDEFEDINLISVKEFKNFDTKDRDLELYYNICNLIKNQKYLKNEIERLNKDE